MDKARAAFPAAKFIIVSTQHFPDVLSTRTHIVIKCVHNCDCYVAFPRVNEYILVRKRTGSAGITHEDAYRAMVDAAYDPKCAHNFLDRFDMMTDVQFMAEFGS